jgi:hypothetical protein
MERMGREKGDTLARFRLRLQREMHAYHLRLCSVDGILPFYPLSTTLGG